MSPARRAAAGGRRPHRNRARHDHRDRALPVLPEDQPADAKKHETQTRRDDAPAHRAHEVGLDQAAGLLAISLGLSLNYQNDHEMLEHGMVMYDALYAWCRQAP